MAIGSMRHRVELYSRTESRDSYGEVDVTWSLKDTVWASLDYISANSAGVEGVEAEKVISMQKPTFTIRHRDDVDETWKVRWDGQDYDIRQVLRLTGKKGYNRMYMKLVCEKTREGTWA